MGDSDLERLRRDTTQRASVARTLDGATGPGCSVPGQDGFNVQTEHPLEQHVQVPTHTEQNDHISSREHSWVKIAHLRVPK